MEHIALGLLCFAVGLVLGGCLGWFAREKMEHLKPGQEGRIIALIITLLYAASVIADIYLQDYETPMLLHGIMGALVGFLWEGRKNVK